MSVTLDALECDADLTVTLTYPVTATCPVDGRQDEYTVRIEYEPGRRVVELSSLANWLDGFENRVMPHERLCDLIHRELWRATNPEALSVEMVGEHYGIQTEVRRSL